MSSLCSGGRSALGSAPAPAVSGWFLQGQWGREGTPGLVWGRPACLDSCLATYCLPHLRQEAESLSLGVLTNTLGTSASVQQGVTGTGFPLSPETKTKKQTDQTDETMVFKTLDIRPRSLVPQIIDYLCLLPMRVSRSWYRERGLRSGGEKWTYTTVRFSYLM